MFLGIVFFVVRIYTRLTLSNKLNVSDYTNGAAVVSNHNHFCWEGGPASNYLSSWSPPSPLGYLLGPLLMDLDVTATM